MTMRTSLVVASCLASVAHAAPEPPAPSRPAAPIVAPGDRTFVAFAGRPARVRIAWAAVTGAKGYRVKLLDGDVALPAAATSHEYDVSRPGRHRIAVIAIDERGTESVPAEPELDIVVVHAIAPGSDAPRAFDAAAFAVGTTFSSPGLACSLGGGAAANEVVALAPGATVLRCGGGAGQPRVEQPIVVTPVTVIADTVPLTRGLRDTIHITLASAAPIGEHFDIDAIGDLDLGDAVRTAAGIDVPVTAGPDAREVGLRVRAGATELGRIELAVTEPPPPPQVITRPDWFAVDLGLHIGAWSAPEAGGSATRLGTPTDAGDVLTSGPLFGVRLGLFPTRRVGLELESSIVTPGYASRQGVAAFLVERLQLAARVVEDGRFGLRGLLGGDLLAVLTEAGTSTRGSHGALHYGVAFGVETRRNVSVRFQVLHVMTVARDAGYAHCIEMQAGLVWRLGRRDRWN